MPRPTMPWGKYKGVPIDEIPEDYLVWVYTRSEAYIDEWTLDAIRERLWIASEESQEELSLEQRVKHWYRGLAKHFHPDHGGSDQAMIVVNVAHDSLRAWLGLDE